jgi:hypothetical protein
MKLEISVKNQFQALKELLIISFIYFGLICFLFLYAEFDLFKILFLSTFAFYFFIILLPVLILHVNYLITNKYQEIMVENNKLFLDNEIYTINDIDKINLYATNQHINNLTGAYTPPYAKCYYYIEICLKSGIQINLSSLIDYNIDKIIKENFKTIVIKEYPSNFLLLLIK